MSTSTSGTEIGGNILQAIANKGEDRETLSHAIDQPESIGVDDDFEAMGECICSATFSQFFPICFTFGRYSDLKNGNAVETIYFNPKEEVK
jgi:hypothetical protein